MSLPVRRTTALRIPGRFISISMALQEQPLCLALCFRSPVENWGDGGRCDAHPGEAVAEAGPVI